MDDLIKKALSRPGRIYQEQINALKMNNEFWACECEKLHTLGWYKVGFFASCALNLAFIFGIVGWWLWLK
jgi:hypothetical protein